MRYLCSLGSNIQPRHNVPAALQQLVEHFSPISISRIVRTSPVGMKSKRPFLNALFTFDSDLIQADVKRILNQIETALGRDRRDPHRAKKDRTIDIDILACGDFIDMQRIAASANYLAKLARDLDADARQRNDGVQLTMADDSIGQRPSTIHIHAATGHVCVVDQVSHRF